MLAKWGGRGYYHVIFSKVILVWPTFGIIKIK